MVKTLGVIFGVILFSVPIIWLDAIGNDFLQGFFRNQAIGIAATVLALNVAAMTFLLGHLITLETKTGILHFTGTKNEIRQNMYFMTAMFVVMFITTTAMGDQTWTFNGVGFNPLVLLDLVAFALIFVCLLEVVGAIFTAVSPDKESTKKTSKS